MKKKRYSPDKDLPFLTIEATLDAGTASLGVRPDEPYRCGANGKKNRKHGPDGQTMTAVFTDLPPEDGGAESCRCHITVSRDAGEWLPVPQTGFFRYKDALTERCLSLASETVGFDLIPHITGIKAISPPESDRETLASYGEPMQKLADKLFPKSQRMRITEIRETGSVPVLRLEKTDGFTAAPFRAGQFVTISPADATSEEASPFLLCSSPAGAREGYYLVTPAPDNHGTANKEIVNSFHPGGLVDVSAPQGDFHYSSLRDRETVIGFADAAGLGAFLSMGYALRDGLEIFKLTVIYLETHLGNLPFTDELTALGKSGKLRLFRIGATSDGAGLNAGYLRAHLPHEAYSVFICGEEPTRDTVLLALHALHLPAGAVRCSPPQKQK